MSTAESTHEYQDNGSPAVPDFAQRFCQVHVTSDLSEHELGFLPTPGSKAMLGLIPLSCGASKKGEISVVTDPGYPTPGDWCSYLGKMVDPHHFTMDEENRFRFQFSDIRSGDNILATPRYLDLAMMNYPNNPSSQVASKEWLEGICKFCQQHNIRLFNDAAYAILAHTDDHCTLTDVAVHFPNLSWAEAFSASKAGNFTGWRVGAMVGSPDFIGDIATIKGNTDSGAPGPLMAGIIEQFENGRDEIEAVRVMYFDRIHKLKAIMKKVGMKLAVEPGAGFFTLWQTPKRAFGEEITSAEHFNTLMIQKTGIVGVYFEPYIRYAVVGDIDAMAGALEKGFAAAEISYN